MLGRFEIVREVGRGGSGVVYEANDRLLGATIALKRMVGPRPGATARLRRTVLGTSDLYQRNVVVLGEIVKGREDWYLTMELVEGMDVLRWVRGDRGPGAAPDERRLRPALVQTAEALLALHGAGIVHRDVKPSNVIATKEGRLVLVDLGLAAELGPPLALVPPGSIGTPAYMAPEQATTTYASPALDWYAFGVLLYQCLTGSLPYDDGGLSALLAKRTMPPVPVQSRAPQAPHALAQLAMDLLARDPDMRPSGSEVLARLDAAPARLLRPCKPPFVGRAQVLMKLFSELDRAAEGGTVLCRVVGQWGSGRGAVLNRFGDLVAQRGPGVCLVRVRGSRHERVPLTLVDAVLEGCGAVAGPVDDGEGQPPQAWAELLAVTLRAQAQGRVIALVIEDADWLDRESQIILRKLLRMRVGPMLVACSMESRSFLQVAGADVVDVPVGPLAEPEARELAHLLIGACGGQSVPTDCAPCIARHAGGLPGLIVELTRTAIQAGCGRETLLARRLSQLSVGALRLAAASGRRLSASGVASAEILPALHELEAARVARPSAKKRDVLATSHPDVPRLARERLAHIAP